MATEHSGTSIEINPNTDGLTQDIRFPQNGKMYVARVSNHEAKELRTLLAKSEIHGIAASEGTLLDFLYHHEIIPILDGEHNGD